MWVFGKKPKPNEGKLCGFRNGSFLRDFLKYAMQIFEIPEPDPLIRRLGWQLTLPVIPGRFGSVWRMAVWIDGSLKTGGRSVGDIYIYIYHHPHFSHLKFIHTTHFWWSKFENGYIERPVLSPEALYGFDGQRCRGMALTVKDAATMEIRLIFGSCRYTYIYIYTSYLFITYLGSIFWGPLPAVRSGQCFLFTGTSFSSHEHGVLHIPGTGSKTFLAMFPFQ